MIDKDIDFVQNQIKLKNQEIVIANTANFMLISEIAKTEKQLKNLKILYGSKIKAYNDLRCEVKKMKNHRNSLLCIKRANKTNGFE